MLAQSTNHMSGIVGKDVARNQVGAMRVERVALAVAGTMIII